MRSLRRLLVKSVPPEMRQGRPTLESLREEVKDLRSERADDIASHYQVHEELTQESPQDATCVGIDLGTSNSCLSYFDSVSGKPLIIPNKTGSWVYPTVIAFAKDHKVRLFGEAARISSKSNPRAALSSGKRLIGRRFGELGRVINYHNRTNELRFSSTGETSVEVEGRVYSVVHITGMFLRHLKKSAEENLGRPVSQCVVSVPAYFTPAQKVATEDAALIAGFDVLEVIDEPTAASLTYTLLGRQQRQMEQKQQQYYFVMDLGGGTLDCAVLRYRKDSDTLTVIGTHGDPILGGNDWDSVLANHFTERFRKNTGIDLIATQRAGPLKYISLEAEKAKIALTHSDLYRSHMRSFHFCDTRRDVVPLSIRLDSTQYEFLTRPLVDRCIRNLYATLQKVQLRARDIDGVLLVGGMTRDPPLQRAVTEFFGKEPVRSEHCPADYAVAMGAAVRGAMLKGLLPDFQTKTEFDLIPTTKLRKALYTVRRALGLSSTALPTVKWRGKATGYSDENIRKYAKEIVEHEAQTAHRKLIEDTEEQADKALIRLNKHTDFRQGDVEQKFTSMQDQVKFWQYMVHHTHKHEACLQKAVRELNLHLDELEGKGLAVHPTAVDSTTGKVILDPSKVLRKVAAKALPKGSSPEAVVLPKSSSRATLQPAESTLDNLYETALKEMASHEPPPPPGLAGVSVHAALHVLQTEKAMAKAQGEEEKKSVSGGALPVPTGEEDMKALLQEFRRKHGSCS